MKLPYFIGVWCTSHVAPLVGAWIEILILAQRKLEKWVAPLVGAWIEISGIRDIKRYLLGRSSCRSVD